MTKVRKSRLVALGSVTALTKGVIPGARTEPTNPFLSWQG